MIKKILKYLAILCVAALVVIQFFAIDKTNPAVVQAETMEVAIDVPADVGAIMERSCNDCHSHKSVYPWYTYVQPVGWFVKGHIDDARRHLNFSSYNTYSLKKKAHKLEEVCEQMDAKAMPLPSYLWIHRDAVLSSSESDTLCNWANAEKAKLDVLLASEPGS